MTHRMAQQLSNGNTNGTVLGCSTDLIGFYGATPVVQPTSADEAAVSTAAVDTIANDANGTAIATAVNALITQVASQTTLLNQVRADLVTLGLIKGS